MGNLCIYPDKCAGGYRLLLVQRNISGYRPTKYGAFKSEEAAWDKAMELNEDMGIYSKEAVLEIVGSAMGD